MVLRKIRLLPQKDGKSKIHSLSVVKIYLEYQNPLAAQAVHADCTLATFRREQALQVVLQILFLAPQFHQPGQENLQGYL